MSNHFFVKLFGAIHAVSSKFSYKLLYKNCILKKSELNWSILKISINLTANALSGGHYPGEIAGKKGEGKDTGIIGIAIEACPPYGESTRGIAQSFSGAIWILAGPCI